VRAENPGNKYPIYFAPQPAMMTGDWKEAKILLDEAVQLLPEEPLIVSLLGIFYAFDGERWEGARLPDQGLCEPKILWTCLTTATINSHAFSPCWGRVKLRSSGWSEVSSNGFACWPFFLKDALPQEYKSTSGV